MHVFYLDICQTVCCCRITMPTSPLFCVCSWLLTYFLLVCIEFSCAVCFWLSGYSIHSLIKSSSKILGLGLCVCVLSMVWQFVVVERLVCSNKPLSYVIWSQLLVGSPSVSRSVVIKIQMKHGSGQRLMVPFHPLKVCLAADQRLCKPPGLCPSCT